MASELTGKQAQACALLAQGRLHKEVAEAVGISAGTISEWLKQPQFVAQLNNLKMSVLEAALAQIQHLAGAAAATLEDLLQNGPPAVRLKAAEVVLAHAGLSDPQDGRYAWGIGPRDPGKLVENEKQQKKFDELIKQLSV